MTRHNWLQRRTSIVKQIRDTMTSLIWHMNDDYPQGRRARSLASRKLCELHRDLHRLLANEPRGTTSTGAA